MAYLEIERKFLVRGEYKTLAYDVTRIRQGYIASGNGRTVRVRIRGDKGYLTIKGPSDRRGLGRFEWEKEISVAEAEALKLENVARQLEGKTIKKVIVVPNKIVNIVVGM